MVLSEGIQAGYSAGKVVKTGYRWITSRAKGFFSLRGQKMSDYADVVNRGNALDARNAAFSEGAEDLAQVLAFKFTQYSSELLETSSDAVFHSGASAVNEIRSGVGLVQGRELKAAQEFSRLNSQYGEHCR